MTNVVTLDYLKSKADEEFAPYQIEMDGGILTIRNPVRLAKDERDRIAELQKELNEIYEKTDEDEDGNRVGELDEGDDEKMHAAMLEVLSICSDNKKLFNSLNAELRNDLGLTQIIFYDWLGEDEVGEASSSAD